jgi:hypothetical protein
LVNRIETGHTTLHVVQTLSTTLTPTSQDCTMHHDPMKFATTAAALLVLAGCMTSETAQTPASGACNAAAAQRLLGQLKPSDADAMRLTGATIVRQIAPGDPVTHDLRDNRVTIATDPASGRVVGATCG